VERTGRQRRAIIEHCAGPPFTKALAAWRNDHATAIERDESEEPQALLEPLTKGAAPVSREEQWLP